MKLIKIAHDHYVIVDDSKIQEGDVIYLLYGNTPSTKQGGIARCEFPDANNLGVLWKKITHSTQPESLGMGWMQSVLPLLLSEVKELIGEVDVVELSKKTTKHQKFANGLHEEVVAQMFYRKGYNQALEDNKDKKWTDDDLRKIFIHGKELGLTIAGSIRNGGDKPNQYMWFNEYIESLQPKTEWEVEFVDGKLALKK